MSVIGLCEPDSEDFNDGNCISYSGDVFLGAAVSSLYIFKPCGTGVGERKGFSEEFALELCPRKRPEISHRKIPGNSISDRESSKFKNFKVKIILICLRDINETRDKTGKVGRGQVKSPSWFMIRQGWILF